MVKDKETYYRVLQNFGQINTIYNNIPAPLAKKLGYIAGDTIKIQAVDGKLIIEKVID